MKAIALYATEEQLRELANGDRETLNLKAGAHGVKYVSLAKTENEDVAEEFEH